MVRLLITDFYFPQTGRLVSGHPRFEGHSGKVLDIKFNPFNANILASAGEDSRIKVSNFICLFICCFYLRDFIFNRPFPKLIAQLIYDINQKFYNNLLKKIFIWINNT